MVFYKKVSSKLKYTKLTKESLNRYLKYLAIEENTPIMTTEKLLATMAKQGYIEKSKDMSSGEERFDYHLGPRGKIEVGKTGTLNFLKEVFPTANGFSNKRYMEMNGRESWRNGWREAWTN